jgi:hypothetical protein
MTEWVKDNFYSKAYLSRELSGYLTDFLVLFLCQVIAFGAVRAKHLRAVSPSRAPLH